MATPQWKANAAKESLKLTPKESDWCLAGMEDLQARRTPQKPGRFRLDSSDDSFIDEDTSFDDEDEIALDDWNDVKPPPSRLIVEEKALKELVEQHTKCPECGRGLEMTSKTMTIATSFCLKCKSNDCSYVHHGASPAAAKVPQLDDNCSRNTDCAINVLCVSSVISNGDGPREAGRLLGILGLPNDI